MEQFLGIVELYFLRHGIAEPQGSRPESERRLTPEGIEKTTNVARGIRRLGLAFDLILSSPYVRARQTAEILAVELGLENRFECTSALLYTEPFERLIGEINQNYSKKNSIVLVGHEPYLSELISLLISGTLKSEIVMKKGGFARVSLARLTAGQCGRLEWLIPPKLFIES